MKLFNSLSRQIEAIQPITPPKVGVYTCGPTVYSFVTVGNWRTYVLGDWLVRTLKYLGYRPDYIMNITDVGHLTGDNLGDADLGEDRLEKAATKEGRSAWDLAKFYTDDFLVGYDQLHLTHPRVWCKATDHITEQIEMVKEIEAKGVAYKISDGIYFDTKQYEAAGNVYGELSTLDLIKAGARVEENLEKKDARDFALWKFSPKDKKRQMEWESPWGIGFPGWHIECSAMSRKYLGEQFEIHVGGEDLRSTHHPNEIAQAEAASGKKPFVKYWVHGAFLLVDGGRMGKSLGNAYTLKDLQERGFEPEALKYFYLSGHYRKQLNFTLKGLEAAQQAYRRLSQLMQDYRQQSERDSLSPEKLEKIDLFRNRFKEAIEDDLNYPQALAVAWEVIKSNIPNRDKYDLVAEFDEVLGLNLTVQSPESTVPSEIQKLIYERDIARSQGNYTASDAARNMIMSKGYIVKDTPEGTVVKLAD